MKRRGAGIFDKIRLAALVLCVVLTALALPPCFARVEAAGKTVRVGWFESPFNQTDAYGRRSGCAFDYQIKIAAYTGWEYEYVEGAWPELLQKLKDGEIDLLSDVFYTKESVRQAWYGAKRGRRSL